MKRTRPTSLLQSVALILVFVTFCNSQSLDELIRGPLLGFTYTPEVGKFDISASYVNVNANSLYDGDGKEMTYNDVFDGYADPEVLSSWMYFGGEYALTNDLSFGIAVPFILDQKIEYNPASGYESYFLDRSGETGLGDIQVSAWYQLLKDEKMSLQGALGYQLATGSSPEDVSENNYSSTGSGHTAIDGGLNIDFLAASKILISGYGNYTINQEAQFSSDGYSWDEKQGNYIMVGGRATMSATPQLSLGLHFNYYASGKTEIDGESIDDSESKSTRITPMVGYKIQTPGYTAHIRGSYRIPLGGQNMSKSNGFTISITTFL